MSNEPSTEEQADDPKPKPDAPVGDQLAETDEDTVDPDDEDE